MLGLDTNVLVRFLVKDDAAQYERARRLIKREIDAEQAVLVSQLVLLETEWVLRSRYELSKAEIVSVMSSLLESLEVQIEDEASVSEAVYRWNESAAEFADCLIASRHRSLGCRATATFDAKASRLEGFVSV